MDGFAEALRDLRSRRGLSLRGLGALTHYSYGYLWDLEQGKKRPSPQAAVALDRALGGAGALVAAAAHPVGLVSGDVAGVPDWDGRVAAQVMGRLRPDRTVAEQLAQVLDLHRRMEDTAGARAVLTPVLAQAQQVAALRANADGDLHDELLSLESQVAQFAGWLHQDQAQTGQSEQWYARALSQAHELGDEDMVASILSMTSNVAWSRGDVRRAVRLGEAACRPQASAAVLALSQQQAARSYAASGRRTEALAALGRAMDLAEAAHRAPSGWPAWVYFFTPDRIEVQRALCLRELGDYPAAITGFEQAIGHLGSEFRRDRAQNLARLAVTFALAGERDGALATATEARALAEDTGSARALAELDRVRDLLGGGEPAPGRHGGNGQGQE